MSVGDFLISFIEGAEEAIDERIQSVTKDIKASFNAIIELKEIDCAGNWVVYLKTAVPAAGEAIWLLLTPSPQEIFESYLEPKTGRRGGRRGRRGERQTGRNLAGRRRIYFGGGIPDIDNMIADRIPGRGFFAGRKIGPKEWLFWTGIRVHDAIAWHFLLLAATKTFTTKWVSGLKKSGLCRTPSHGQAYVETYPLSGAHLQPCWADSATLPVDETKNMEVGNTGFVLLKPDGTESEGFALCEVTFTVERDSTPGTAKWDVGFLLQKWNYPGVNETLIYHAERLTCSADNIASITVSQHVAFEDSTRWQMQYLFIPVTPLGLVSKQATAKLAIEATKIFYV